jgi:hypothetical protein
LNVFVAVCCCELQLILLVQDNNGIGDEGAKAIASALKENRTVQELHLVKFGFVLYFLRVLCCCVA